VSGSTGPKRTPEQRERDFERIAGWYLRGWSQAAIAAELKLSHQQISLDIKEIRRRWSESSLASIDEKIEKELARIDRLEATAWDAWERSVGEIEIRTVKSAGVEIEKVSGPGQADDPKSEDPRESRLVEIESTVRTEHRAGDPRFLERIGWCINRRIEVLGIDPPKKIAPTNPAGDEPWDGGAEARGQLLAALTRTGLELPPAESSAEGES
jgi:hypothetical protein